MSHFVIIQRAGGAATPARGRTRDDLVRLRRDA
jgi:hypothetical protein